MSTESGFRTCPQCGSKEIVEGIPLNQTAEAGNIGLSYRAWGPFRGTAPLFADLCQRCGTVVRLFVREPDKRWISH